jgi:hypothetical protein
MLFRRRHFRFQTKLFLFLPAFFLTACAGGWAKSNPAGLEEKIKQTVIPHAESLAALPAVVEAVKKTNAAFPSKMTNEKWKQLPVSSDLVQRYQNNAAAKALIGAKAGYVAEAFVNAADGSKVAFLEKTTFWTHANAAKHKQPMQGKTWVGDLQLDDSSGSNQVQISVPVKDGGKIIGSLVIGAAITKL